MKIRKITERKPEDYFSNLLNEGVKPPKEHGGITRELISLALANISLNKPNIIDAVFCLLDEKCPNLYKPHKGPISDGASTGQIGSYIGIFLNNGKKRDREGRDYWLKPLTETGLVEKVSYSRELGKFLHGHLTSKSSNNAYRLSNSFAELLKTYNQKKAIEYFNRKNTTQRLIYQTQVIAESTKTHGRGEHFDLIELSLKHYIPIALPAYIPVYVDNGDGDRINLDEKIALEKANIKLTLNDSFPDIILYNEQTNTLWFVEVVCSDGEVDQSKLENLHFFCDRNGKKFGGATTIYPNWKTYLRRQTANLNIAFNTYVWVAEDPTRVHFVKAIDDHL